MRWYIILLFLVAACGQRVDITYHLDTPREYLEARAGYPVDGYAYRKWSLEGHWECDIYLAPRPDSMSDNCWNALILHEQQHCREGEFHPNTLESSAIACE